MNHIEWRQNAEHLVIEISAVHAKIVGRDNNQITIDRLTSATTTAHGTITSSEQQVVKLNPGRLVG
ncbi:hypothetical protein, partial [endosymbiont of Tevnia jerichonana]|uniref:hypothetical protein n=1 Tax=endosymbiont of Tevnia jerichonana TaxID=94785 RepID=UPI000594991D